MERFECLMKMIDAGFTKDEIYSLVGEKKETPVEQPVTNVAPIEEKKEEPVVNNVDKAVPSYTLTSEQLQQLIQGVAVQTASGTIEMPQTAQDKLAARFKDIMERK